jgi:hypothetical protein
MAAVVVFSLASSYGEFRLKNINLLFDNRLKFISELNVQFALAVRNSTVHRLGDELLVGRKRVRYIPISETIIPLSVSSTHYS